MSDDAADSECVVDEEDDAIDPHRHQPAVLRQQLEGQINDQIAKEFEFKRIMFCFQTIRHTLKFDPSLADVPPNQLIGIVFWQIVEQVVAGQDHDD